MTVPSYTQGVETISGSKTFQAPVSVATPTQNSHAATKAYVDATTSAGAPDASTSNKGLVQLTGDLGGTATAPTVPGLTTKANSSDVYTKAQVDSALNAKADAGSLATVATSGSYADLTNKPTIPTVSNAATTSKGIVQLAGDLGGTATTPTVPGLASKASSNITVTGANSISGGGDLSANRTLALVNDSSTPGSTKYYGTDVSGTKGFFDLPATGSGTYASLGNKTIDFAGSGADYICDGTNDQLEIQQAINTFTAAGGGVIRFQAGTYDIRATITVPKNPQLKLQGAYVTKTGFGGTTLKVNSALGSNLTAIISEAGTSPAVTSNSDLSHASQYDQLIFDGNSKADAGLLLLNTDQIDTTGQTSVTISDTHAVSFVANTGSRWRTYSSYDTAIQQKYHDGTSGRLFMTKTAVVNATQTIIADGTGDVVYGIIGTLIVNNAGTVVMQSFSLPPDGSNLDITAGTSTWRFSVSTLGAFTVIRTAGTSSGTITINATWQ